MFTFLLVVHAIIAAALVTVILMQRSEGGGLGMGSGPSGLMTARGAADFLSRATAVLATAFVLMAFLLAALASMRNSGGAIDTSLAGQGQAGPITAPAPAGAAPGAGAIPMMGGAPAATGANAPVPPGPDPVTAQALQPAAVGAPQQQQKAAVRPAPRAHTAADFRTIDTGAAAKGAIGIGGVTAAPKPADKPAPAPGNSQ